MREILFRGKRIDNGEWVKGMLVRYNSNFEAANIADENGLLYAVKTETVGQYTGLTDKNGKKIFDGDIIQITETGEIGIVQWFPEHSAFMVWRKPLNEITFLYEYTSIIFVGNIHDNPEPLK